MYSILSVDNQRRSACKGVQRAIKNDVITHEDYRKALFEKSKRYDSITQIVCQDHKIFTVKKLKNTLTPFNDKKWIHQTAEGKFLVLSFGHYRIKQIIKE